MLFQSISGIFIICISWEVSVNTIVRHLNSSGILLPLMHHRVSRVQVNSHPSPSLTSSQSSCSCSHTCILLLHSGLGALERNEDPLRPGTGPDLLGGQLANQCNPNADFHIPVAGR